MEKAYIQWNLVNWVTVVLMAALGTIIVGAVLSAVRQYHGGGNSGME